MTAPAGGTGGGTPVDERAAEIASALAGIRTRISDICAATARDPRSVTLVAVTKTHPLADVQTLLRLGVFDIGESRDQEARSKVAGLNAEAARWHFVGRLQRRKARSVASYAFAVHSVDRLELVAALADAVDLARRAPIEVFVQVSLDGDPARGGAAEPQVAPLAAAIAGRPELNLAGVMAVAPLGTDPDRAFGRLAEVAARVRRDHPAATAISAGMSEDLAAALRHGSTHVRVGSALLGRRGPVVG
jgi:hypothetical protein